MISGRRGELADQCDTQLTYSIMSLRVFGEDLSPTGDWKKAAPADGAEAKGDERVALAADEVTEAKDEDEEAAMNA